MASFYSSLIYPSLPTPFFFLRSYHLCFTLFTDFPSHSLAFFLHSPPTSSPSDSRMRDRKVLPGTRARIVYVAAPANRGVNRPVPVLPRRVEPIVCTSYVAAPSRELPLRDSGDARLHSKPSIEVHGGNASPVPPWPLYCETCIRQPLNDPASPGTRAHRRVPDTCSDRGAVCGDSVTESTSCLVFLEATLSSVSRTLGHRLCTCVFLASSVHARSSTAGISQARGVQRRV